MLNSFLQYTLLEKEVKGEFRSQKSGGRSQNEKAEEKSLLGISLRAPWRDVATI